MELDELRDEIAYECASEFMATGVIEEDCDPGVAIKRFWTVREGLKELLTYLSGYSEVLVQAHQDDIEHQLLRFDEKIHEHLTRAGNQYRWYLYKAGIPKENVKIIEGERS